MAGDAKLFAMKQTIKYSKVLTAIILLGIVTGLAFRPRGVPSQKVLQGVVSTPVMPAVVVTAAAEPVQTRILFTGDINLGRCIAKRTLSTQAYTGDYNYPF